MINTGAFEPLSASEQEEYERHVTNFQQAVASTNITDPFEFENKYYLQKIDGRWGLTQPGANIPLANITVSQPNILEALLNHALASIQSNH